VGDLRDRTPGHGLIQRLLTEFEKGRIHLSANPKWLEVEVEDGAESWYRGVLGERCVGQILSALPDTWTVLHSVPVGHGNRDIDHVVIGPGGVFTINTKYSPGKDVWARGIGLLVGGHRTRYVFKACEEARDAAQRLTAAIDARVSVTGIIVFVEPGRMRVQPPVGDQLTVVKVVRDTDLLDSLHSRDPLTSQKIARIVEAAVRPRDVARATRGRASARRPPRARVRRPPGAHRTGARRPEVTTGRGTPASALEPAAAQRPRRRRSECSPAASEPPPQQASGGRPRARHRWTDPRRRGRGRIADLAASASIRIGTGSDSNQHCHDTGIHPSAFTLTCASPDGRPE
jgi:hypothetical protein